MAHRLGAGLVYRERYADAVRDDPDAGFLASVKPGESRQVSIWIDEFAKANRMPSCRCRATCEGGAMKRTVTICAGLAAASTAIQRAR